MSLTIEQVIARVPSWEKASTVTMSLLPGGITNISYLVDVDGEAFVVRIAARNGDLLGIDRRREHQCVTAASQTGVAPEVIYSLADEGILVTRFIRGRRPSPEEMARPEMMERVVRSMRRYHAGPMFEGSFSPFETIVEYQRVAHQFGAPLPQDIDPIQARIREIEAALRRGQTLVRPCHNDLWGPNLIDDGSQVRIVDWEYAGMGDVCFDLANFAIHSTASDDQDEVLLQAYFGEVSDAVLARLKLLKIVAEFREALWYLVALNVSSNTSGFTRHAETHFDRCRQALNDARLPVWLDQVARE
ncbi:MAG: phosphotransferase [Armatimonadetes bacterium]|nr:phosphotransferase [Armatimonadota bacterium]